MQVRHGPDGPNDPWSWYASRVGATLVPSFCYLLGGISCALRWGGGLYWLAPATLLAFLGAVYNAWVLLVEIIRQQPEPPTMPKD